MTGLPENNQPKPGEELPLGRPGLCNTGAKA